MAGKKEYTKEEKIKKEKTRLKGIFKNLDENKKKLVSDIVVLGGYNDCSVNATQVQITDKVKEFVDYCKKNYPNAKITIGSISFDYNSAETQGKLVTYKDYYKKRILWNCAESENGYTARQ